MDPISQACFGASLSQSSTNDRTKQISALVIGALAGMAPDLDIFIRSSEDPLLFLEFHRQFTHSLFFIPFGALLCALFFYPFAQSKWIKSSLSFRQIYLFSFLGYATHGLLDACTSYGTQLFWPFSNERVSWNTISIIDPLFTLPVTLLILLAAFRKKPHYAKLAFIYAVIYLSLGLIQKQRAEDAIYDLAAQRNHKPVRIMQKPSFGNRHVWKIIYEHDNRYYIDAVRLLWNTEIIRGSSIKKLNVKDDFWWLPDNSQQAKDIERFRWFSDDFLAFNPKNPNSIMDVRYSFIPNKINPMWHIEIDQKNIDDGKLDSHITYRVKRDVTEEARRKFIEMVF
jgi:inner membrane protein